MSPKLSARIEARLEHCKRCGGTGSFKIDGYTITCPQCADWITTLKAVWTLESQIERLRMHVSDPGYPKTETIKCL